MNLKTLINLQDFKTFWKDTISTNEHKVIMEQIGVEFWIRNSKRELREIYQDLLIFKDQITAYIKINEQKINYIITSAKQEFLSIEFTQQNRQQSTNNDELLAFNRDYYGGQGQVGKDTNTNTANMSGENTSTKTDKQKMTYNFADAANNSIFKNLANKLFETFYIDESLHW